MEDETDSDYDLDFDSYQPVRGLYNEHEVTVITPRLAELDHNSLQAVNHGTTLVRWEEDSGRSVRLSVCTLFCVYNLFVCMTFTLNMK